MNALDIILTLLSLPAIFCAGYLLLLTLAARKAAVPTYGEARTRFDVIVPAHNEQEGIAQTIKSLLEVDYPAAQRRVVVVADNCTDETADRARAAGATVLVRNDTSLRGKGYALDFAFERSLEERAADAVVVVDADTVVTKNLLRAFAYRLENGANALQAEYGVRNAVSSWRTRLMTIAFALFHDLRSLARERFGVSCGLRGNGMCFSHALIRAFPHNAFSLTEDVEYGIRLGLGGHRVGYVGEAKVYGEMVSGERASRSQRERWENGRIALLKLFAPRLVREAFARKDRVLFDLAMDVLVPPLSWLTVAVSLFFAAGTALSFFEHRVSTLLAVSTFGVFSLICYVVRGCFVSGLGFRALLDLLYAPFYVLWKLSLMLRGRSRKKDEWVRTSREGQA